MASNKDRITNLEEGLGLLQDEVQKLNGAFTDRFRGIESSLHQMMEDMMQQNRESLREMQAVIASSRDTGASASRETRRTGGPSPSHPRDEHTNPFAPQQQPHRFVKLEFPRFDVGDPTEWLSKAKQYFAYHEMSTEHRVNFASYHLTDEANEWWQATTKALGLPTDRISWETFEEELWIRFGPTDGEDFDEALSKIRQKGSLREYQREFERLIS